MHMHALEHLNSFAMIETSMKGPVANSMTLMSRGRGSHALQMSTLCRFFRLKLLMRGRAYLLRSQASANR